MNCQSYSQRNWVQITIYKSKHTDKCVYKSFVSKYLIINYIAEDHEFVMEGFRRIQLRPDLQRMMYDHVEKARVELLATVLVEMDKISIDRESAACDQISR